jgi:hypothetical protein
MIKRRKMNTIVNITGITLKCLGASDESAIKKAKKRKWYLKNREKIIKKALKYYLENKEKIKKRQEITKKIYYNNNREKINKRAREYYCKNKEKKLLRNKIYRTNNKEKVKAHDIWRSKNNVNRKLSLLLRRRTLLALKDNSKSKNTMSLLGIENIEFLWKHLESTFKPGMTRENHGLWHIDHIRPCSSFDLSKPEEQSKCFHYTNLQALWAYENLSKSNKITTIS